MEVFPNLHAFIWQSMTANNCNTYLIDGSKRILIDPGHRALFDHVERGLKQIGLTIADIDLILGTHGHPDHIEAVQLFQDKKALFALHHAEWKWIETEGKPMAAAMGLDLDTIKPDFFLKEGALSVDGIELQVIQSPGHSPGSVCLYWPDHKALFTGDLVFDEGIGRTDLPGGNGATLKASIKSLTDLDIEYLLPGHGSVVSGAEEIRSNFSQIESFWFQYI
jgi:glyoxylase-like metal-dependent hydrolase (beta-lactamase superfamily II)